MLDLSENSKFIDFICDLDAIIQLQEEFDAADNMVV